MIYSNIMVTSLRAEALSFSLYPTVQKACRWSRLLTKTSVDFCSFHKISQTPGEPGSCSAQLHCWGEGDVLLTASRQWSGFAGDMVMILLPLPQGPCKVWYPYFKMKMWEYAKYVSPRSHHCCESKVRIWTHVCLKQSQETKASSCSEWMLSYWPDESRTRLKFLSLQWGASLDWTLFTASIVWVADPCPVQKQGAEWNFLYVRWVGADSCLSWVL